MMDEATVQRNQQVSNRKPSAMLDRKLFMACCGNLALLLSASVARSNDLTLRSLGAVGDGKTDDRAAIHEALIKANGSPVDGEGATYAVHGNIEINADVNLRNTTLLQTMAPVDVSKYIPSARGIGKLSVEPAETLRTMVGPLPLLHANGVATYSEDPVLNADELKAVLPTIILRTLAISGSKERPVSVRLKKVRILRGNHPQVGGGDGGAILVDYASPLIMNDVEVTGDGKGSGISIMNSSKVRLERLHIHDMNWAPYIGDNIFETVSVKSIKEDFGWNNFPIYQFSRARNQFVRVRIQEQVAGLQVLYCDDVQLLDSRVAKLQTKIGDRLYPLQSDGVTVANVTNFIVRNCHFYEVWEGIDFTGNRDEGFVCEDCTASDTLTFGFKLAHPKRNGKMINCTSHRAGGAGFVMEPEVENIEFIRCRALETGANGFWTTDDGRRLMTIAGFRLGANPALPTPARIKFENCTAINTSHPDAMDFGFLCEPGINPADREITAIDCTAKGAKVKDIQGFAPN